MSVAGGISPPAAATDGGGRNSAGGIPGPGGAGNGPKGIMEGRYPGGMARRGPPKAVWGCGWAGGGGAGVGCGLVAPVVLLLLIGVTLPGVCVGPRDAGGDSGVGATRLRPTTVASTGLTRPPPPGAVGLCGEGISKPGGIPPGRPSNCG